MYSIYTLFISHQYPIHITSISYSYPATSRFFSHLQDWRDIGGVENRPFLLNLGTIQIYDDLWTPWPRVATNVCVCILLCGAGWAVTAPDSMQGRVKDPHRPYTMGRDCAESLRSVSPCAMNIVGNLVIQWQFSDDPRQLGLSQSFREPQSPMNGRHFRCKRDGYSGFTIWLFNIAMV